MGLFGNIVHDVGNFFSGGGDDQDQKKKKQQQQFQPTPASVQANPKNTPGATPIQTAAPTSFQSTTGSLGGSSNPLALFSPNQSLQKAAPVTPAPTPNPTPDNSQPKKSFWNKLGSGAVAVTKSVAQPFVNVGEDVSNTIGNAEVKAGNAVGIHAKTGEQTNQQQFGDINKNVGLQTEEDTPANFAKSAAQVALTVAAPGADTAAELAAKTAAEKFAPELAPALVKAGAHIISNGAVGGAFNVVNDAGEGKTPEQVLEDFGKGAAVGAAGGAIFGGAGAGFNALRKGTGNAALDDAIETGAETTNDLVAPITTNARANLEEAPTLPTVSDGNKPTNPTNIPSAGTEVSPGVHSENTEAPTATPTTDVVNPQEAAAAEAAGTPTTVADPNVPDPATNPIALAKGDGSVPTSTTSPAVVADFSKAINAPLEKAPAVSDSAAPGVPVQTGTAADAAAVTPEGNAPIKTDEQVAAEAAANGIVATPGASPTAVNEGDLQAAQNTAAKQEVTNTPGQAAAPRTRNAAAALLTDDTVRNDVLDSFPKKAQQMNIEDTHNLAKAAVNNATPQELMSSWGDNASVKTPQDFFNAVESIKRLQTLKGDDGVLLPGAQNSINNAVNAMSDFSATAGKNLRTTQIIFDDMPSALKVQYLTKKLSNAGVDLPDAERAKLDSLIQASDAATDNVNALHDEANKLLGSGEINNTTLTPDIKAKAADLATQIEQGERDRQMAAGEAWQQYQSYLPKGSLGKRTGDLARTLMLSSPAGRVFDVLSTGSTTADDLLNKGVSNLIGKGVNLVKGKGTVESTLPSVQALTKGTKQGAALVKDSFAGKEAVSDFMGQANKASRGQINPGSSRVRQVIRAAVELPTNLTKGLESDQLYRSAVQEANKAGLTGDAADTYAKLRASAPTEEQLHTAQQTHMRANMLHENGISRGLNNIANSLDTKGGGWGASLIRNQVAPFTSWIGGNLNRTLTDKNVLYNAAKIVQGAKNGDTQMVVDNLAHAVVNTGEAYALGVALTKSGIITNQDGNGQSYGGLYFHLGNRYVPVAVLGTASVPLILGNAYNQATTAAANGQDGAQAFTDAVFGNTAKNAGVASTFGGQNTLQSAVGDMTTAGGSPTAGAAEFVGGGVTQFIPAVTGDINSVLDQSKLNPTHQAAQTKVTEINPKTGNPVTDQIATEGKRIENRIPGLSQDLPRNPDKQAADFIDKSDHGSHVTDGQAATADKSQSLDEVKAKLTENNVPTDDKGISSALKDGNYTDALQGLSYQLQEAQNAKKPSKSTIAGIQDKITQAQLESKGVPVTDDGIEARSEAGDYNTAEAGLTYQYDKIKDDQNVPASKKQALQSKITTMQVNDKIKANPDVVAAYASTTNSEWKSLGDSTSDNYNPTLYNELKQYDDALAAAGVSGNKDVKANKFVASTSGTSRGGKSNGGISTDIATNNINFGTQSPIKAETADSASNTKSTIPVLQKAANFDTSKLRKISTSKGGN